MFNINKAISVSVLKKSKMSHVREEKESSDKDYLIPSEWDGKKINYGIPFKKSKRLNYHRFIIGVNPHAIPIKEGYIELIIRDKFLNRIVVRNCFHQDSLNEKIESWVEYYTNKSHTLVVEYIYDCN
jgi:hypothetical protein